jgi:nucleolar protein 53
VHPPNTTNLAGRAKRHGGRTLTLKISRRNWTVFARRNVHSGACFLSTFSVQSSNVICRLPLQKKTDSELFIVDIKGDDKGMPLLTFPLTHKSSHIILVSLSVRKSLPRFSRTTLRSHQIISQRSAVPAVHARPRRSLVSSREKERLLRIARKDRRGPLNSIVDSSQPGEGSALLEVSEAVKQCGQYDMWSAKAKTRLDDGVNVKVCTSVPFSFHPSPN